MLVSKGAGAPPQDLTTLPELETMFHEGQRLTIKNDSFFTSKIAARTYGIEKEVNELEASVVLGVDGPANIHAVVDHVVPFDMYWALLHSEGHHNCQIFVSEEDESADVATKTMERAEIEADRDEIIKCSPGHQCYFPNGPAVAARPSQRWAMLSGGLSTWRLPRWRWMKHEGHRTVCGCTDREYLTA